MLKTIELVDENDTVIGYGEKMDIHKRALLHRAFSIFIYDIDQKKILLQRRGINKYHSGGLWSNSCCSHKYKEESWIEGFKRCIYDELTLEASFDVYSDVTKTCTINDNKDTIFLVGKFKYYSNYGEIKEHEVDRVILWVVHTNEINNIKYNPNEIDEICWASIYEIDQMLKDKKIFTSWFEKAYLIVRNTIKS